MHHCINCGRPAATRQGDKFTCARCGYVWDVALEQASAAYLRAQGREPARPAVEDAAEQADDPVLSSLEELATPVKFDTLSNLETPVGSPLPDFDPVVERAIEPGETLETGTTYEDLTVDELKTLATERGVDLTGHTRKAEIVAALREADDESAEE